MVVYGFTENGHGIREIENTLEAEQGFVGGLIEVIGLTDGLDMVCNDEGKFNGSTPRAALFNGCEVLDIIYGDFFVCRHNGEGVFTDFKKSDMGEMFERLKDVQLLVKNSVLSGVLVYDFV